MSLYLLLLFSLASSLASAQKCDTAQITRAGQCMTCPSGKISNKDGTQCVACASGTGCTVKSPDDNFTPNAKCVSAATVCKSSSISQEGKCTPCSYGMVADASRCKCIVCGQNTDKNINPRLSVKSPNTNFSPDSTCVAAGSEKGCGMNEIANDQGHCTPCPDGQVADKQRAKCIICGQGTPASLNPQGTVKFPNNGWVSAAQCVRADDRLGGCGSSQIANETTGQCTPCSYGEVADTARRRCLVCGKGGASSVNPQGSVKSPNTNFDVNALCIRANAFGGCGTNQIANATSGQCSPCVRGMVADVSRVSCITCGLGAPGSLNPPATVKSPDNGFSVDASCVPGGLQGCGTNQMAREGLCTPCTYGQVADATHSSCVTCGQGVKSSVNPPATVKYPNDMVSVNASCVAARSARGCGTNQYADKVTGLCNFCPDGQVTNNDGSACNFCGVFTPIAAGKQAKASPKPKAMNAKGKSGNVKKCTIKNINAYVVDAKCVLASEACGTNQISVLGKCSSCPAGQIPDEGRCACVACAPCTIKTPNNGFTLHASCVAAALVCGSSAVANSQAQCAPCPLNQVANAGRCQCITCGANNDAAINPKCSYKLPNNNLDMDAVCRLASSCGTSAISLNGKCEFCPFGQVASGDGCRCVVCGQNSEPRINPTLSVKFPNSDHTSTSTCVPAKQGCGSSEIANAKGTCSPCSFGQVANEAHSACVVCGKGASTSRINPPITVKYPNNNHSADATCVPASDVNGCGTNEIANNEGHCRFCTYGQVANADRSRCVVCGQGSPNSLNPLGSVKTPNNEFIVAARCLPSTQACGTNEYANNFTGQCTPCTFGKVADQIRRSCVWCGRGPVGSINPPRTVKYPNNGGARDAVCATPLKACGTSQFANFAQAGCMACSWGEVASEDRLTCVDCEPLTKCPNTNDAVNATCCHPIVPLPG